MRSIHKQFTKNKAEGVESSEDIIYQSIEQLQTMGQSLQGKESLFTKTPWPLKSPVRRDFLTPEGESNFLNEYTIVSQHNQETMRLFPGYYFDRNPRNLMYQNGTVYQVDFGVIEQSSPIFDLMKLLRNGTDVPLPHGLSIPDAKRNLSAVHSLAVYDTSQEETFKDHLYSQ